MGTVAEKLTYLNGTKSSLKTAINNLGGSIDNNTTFRAYASELDSIYSKLPKVSDTGTSISLTPTLKGRLGSIIKGNTYQETTTGKNLLIPNTNKNATTSNGITYTPVYDGEKLLYVNVNGTATADSSYLIQNQSRFDIDNTKSYIANGCPSGGSSSTYNIIIYYYDENGTYLGGVYDTGNGRTIPTSSKILTNIYIKSGTTINNEKFYPMIRLASITDDTYEPYTGGQPSPSPDYSQSLQEATGTQKVVVSGKNKFNTLNKGIDDENITTEIISNNEVKIIYDGNSSTYKRTRFIISGLKENTDYKFKANIENSNSSVTRNWLAIRNSNNTSSLYNARYISDNIVTFNTGSNTTIVCVLYAVGEDAVTNNTATWSDIILAEDVSTYQPYQEPQEVDIELSSRNLVNPNGSTTTQNGITFTNNGDGSFTANGTATANTNFAITTTPIKLKNNTYYTQSVTTISGTQGGSVTPAFKNSGGTITYNYFINNQTKLTTDEMTSHTYNYYIASGTSVNNWTFKVQLEQNNSATSYTPYYNYSLNKIGDYEDYIGGTPDNWVLYKNIGKVVLNGSENWGSDGTLTNTLRFKLATSYFPNSLGQSYTQHTISDYFAFSVNYNSDTQHYYIGATNANSYFFMPKTLVSNVNEFKAWLSTHNVEVIYQLSEPEPTPITEENIVSQLNELYYLQSYNDTTNIDVTGNLPMRITASAIKKV